MRKARAIKYMLAAYMVVTTAGCSLSASSGEPTEERMTPVQVVTIHKGSLSQVNEIIGTARPSAEANVIPRMNGELTRLEAEENHDVEKGAVLGQIDSENLRIQLELEQLSLEQAQSQYKTLRSTNAPQSQLDQAENNLKQLQLRVQLAQNNIDNSVITAPIGGLIVDVAAQVGDFVSSASPAIRIVQLHPIRIEANLSTNQMLAFQGVSKVPVAFPDLNLTGEASIVSVSAVTDNTGFYTLKAEMSNEERRVKSGMMAKLQLESDLVQDTILVPTSAIVEKSGVSSVFVVREGRAAEVTLTVLESQSKLSAVEGDLAEGDSVVIKGQYTLSDGSLVKLIEEAQ